MRVLSEQRGADHSANTPILPDPATGRSGNLGAPSRLFHGLTTEERDESVRLRRPLGRDWAIADDLDQREALRLDNNRQQEGRMKTGPGEKCAELRWCAAKESNLQPTD
jgi:hypothetical protein